MFSDVTPEHWCYDKIIMLEDRSFIDGYEDGTFRPNQTITRAEYVKIVNSFMGIEKVTAEAEHFSDVSSDMWYTPYVNAAKI